MIRSLIAEVITIAGHIIITLLIFQSSASYAGIYNENSASGYYHIDPRIGFYQSGVNKPVNLVEEKSNNEILNDSSKTIENIKSMPGQQLREAYKNSLDSLAENPSSIEDAENYILFNAEIARRKLRVEQTIRDAYSKVREKTGFIDPKRFNDLEEIKRNVRLGFFLSYSEAGKAELSKYAEELISYFSYKGFKIFIVVPSFSEKTDIPDDVLNRVSDVIIDNDGRISMEFGIDTWPACTGFIIKDGTVIKLYEGKDYAENIEGSLMRLYKIYINGSMEFKKVNFTR